MILNDKLNKEQKAAILHNGGPLRIIAGPGSGKTEVLTRKICYLIKSVEYDPTKILAVTFTNKAANSMKIRVKNMIGDKADEVWISTFHSLAMSILRRAGTHLKFKPNFKILDNIDQKSILKSIYHELDISSRNFSFRAATDYIQKIKMNQIPKKEIEEEIDSPVKKTFYEIYKRYESKRKSFHALDFNDLLIEAHKLLCDDDEYAEEWSNKFDYILIDEFQDTSLIQYEMIQKIAPKNKNITIVGDPDQTIYSWRGANANLFLEFDKDFPETTTIKMVQNYRSTKAILASANSLIKNNENRIEKDLYTNNEEGEGVSYYHGSNANFEAKWIVNQIKKLRKKKSQLKDMAILYRANSASHHVEKVLVDEGIEYKIFGGIRFFERSEIKDAVAFLQLIVNPKDDVALERVLNVPSRKIGNATKEKLFAEKTKANLSLLEYFRLNGRNLTYLSKQQTFALRDLYNATYQANVLLNNYKNSSAIVLQKFLKKIGYMEFIQNSDSVDRVENIRELFGRLIEYENKHRGKFDKHQDLISLYLQEISLYLSQDEVAGVVDYVALMTVHAAKGLEFQNVFITRFIDGIFPSSHAINSNDPEALEEERRLAYVAITRAKKRLFISDSKGFIVGTGDSNDHSRFIYELGINEVFRTATQKIIISNFNKNSDSKEINFSVGDRIKHMDFGFGEVISVYDEFIDVAFPEPHGLKSLLKSHHRIESGH